MDGPVSAIASVLACGVPMVLWSVLVDKVHRNPSTGIDWSRRRAWRETIDISLTKLAGLWATWALIAFRSEEHTSELQSLMRISYAVFCLKQKKNNHAIP